MTNPLRLGDVADALQKVGFRAETIQWDDGGRQAIRSGSGGVAFHVVPGAGEEELRDISFIAAFRLPDELGTDLPAAWNQTRRFARLFTRDDLLTMEMDMLVVGGVAEPQLGAAIEVWNHLLNELVALIRARAVARATVSQA